MTTWKGYKWGTTYTGYPPWGPIGGAELSSWSRRLSTDDAPPPPPRLGLGATGGGGLPATVSVSLITICATCRRWLQILKKYIWPVSCEKGPSDICKKCRPRPADGLRRRVWSGSALFDNHNIMINGTYFSCYVNTFIMYRCFQHRIGADLGLHYLKCPKVPFRVTLAI